MKAYMIIYPGDNSAKDRLREAMDSFRLSEHISPNSCIILSFRSEEEILEHLKKYNPENIPLFVLKLPGSVYTSNVDAEYLEPHSMEHL